MSLLLALALIASSSGAEAESAAARGDWAEAARLYRLALEEDTSSYEARFQLARSLSFSGARDEAIRVYSEILERSPNNSDVLLGRGRVFAWEGRWSEAEADLRAATARSPGYADAWSALGDMYAWSDRPAEAAAAYSTWAELRPEDPAPYIARGRARRAADDLTAARADFEAARARGADAGEIDSYVVTLQRRRADQAAEVPEGYRWSAGVTAGVSSFSPERADWRDLTASARRHFTRGSLALEYLAAERFLQYDDAVALDAYLDLWKRAYANVRWQSSEDAELYPDRAYRAEIYQGFGKGWEASGSWSHQDWGNADVDIYGATLAKYVGNWYLRWRDLFIPGTATLGISHGALARYYYKGNADDYVEVSGGRSHGGEILRDGTEGRTRGHSYGGAWQHYFDPRWGFKISGAYADDENSFVERGVSFGVSTRW